MRKIALGLFALLLIPLWPADGVGAAAGLAATGSSSSPTARPGERVAYEVRVSATGAGPQEGLTLSGYLPAGFTYAPGSTTVNGEPATDPAVQGSTLQWSNLPAPTRQSLRLGMNTFVQDNMDKAHITKQFRWTRALTGPGGYVRQLIYPVVASTSGALATWKDFVTLAYDHDLTPVVRLQGYFNPRTGYWDKPEQDHDGGYATMAEAIRRVVADLPRRDGHLLYLEIWNEPNLDADWGGAANPAEYARFLLAAGQAIRSLADPRLVVMNGGMAPGGDYPHLEYLDAMFTAVPAAAYAFDVWASHPYAGNRPPDHNSSFHSLRGYQWELQRLAKYRNPENLKVIATETGYGLGNHEDPSYPPIDESNRAAYTRQAIEQYWSKDPVLLAAMPYELSDPSNRWPGFDWVYPSSETREDGSPVQTHPVYEAVRSIPREGRDVAVGFVLVAPASEGSFRPELVATAAGTAIEVAVEPLVVTSLERAGVISGRVVLEGRRTGAGATVSAGSSRTRTAADGSFHLAVPPGRYAVTATAPGYLEERWEGVSATSGARTSLGEGLLLRGYLLDPDVRE